MEIAEVFQSGNLQTIRFPKTCHLEANKVEICYDNNQIILISLQKQNLEEAFYVLTSLPDDLFYGRKSTIASNPNMKGFLMFMLGTNTCIYVKKNLNRY